MFDAGAAGAPALPAAGCGSARTAAGSARAPVGSSAASARNAAASPAVPGAAWRSSAERRGARLRPPLKPPPRPPPFLGRHGVPAPSALAQALAAFGRQLVPALLERPQHPLFLGAQLAPVLGCGIR